jgi:ABC-2 type transport system ATP-binding protein
VGEVAFGAGIILDELTPQRASLEQAFMEMTKDSVDYAAGTADLVGVASNYPGQETVQ